MAKSKKSKILASMLAVSTMAVFYAAPVMAAELWYNYNGLVITDTDRGPADNKYGQIKKLEGLEEITLGNSVKITTDGNGIIRVGDANGVNTRVYNDGFYVNTSGDDRDGLTETSLKADALTLAGNKLTSVQLANINDVITEEGAVESKGDVTSKTADGTTYTLNTVGNNTQKITFNGKDTVVAGKLVANKFGTPNSSFYVEENGTLKSNKITVNKGEFTVDKKGAVRAADGAFTVDELGNTVSKGDVTSTAADGRIYTLNTVGENTQKITFNGKDTVVAGKLVANKFGTPNSSFYVEENGTLKSNKITVNKGEFTVDKKGAVKAADGAFTVDKDGNTVSKGDVTSTAADGITTYTLNTIGANTAGIERIQNGAGNDITVIEDTLRIYDNGTISTVNEKFKINNQGTVFANAVNVAENAVVISEKSINAFENKFIVNENGGVSTTGINVAERMFTASDGGVTMARGNMKLDTAGNITAGTYNGVEIGMNEAGDIILGGTVIDDNFNSDNVAGITRKPLDGNAPGSANTTYIEQNTAISADGIVVTDPDSGVSAKTKGVSTKTKYDGFYVKEGGTIVSSLEKDELNLAGKNLAYKDSEGNINVTADTYTAGVVAGENVRVKADGIYVKDGGTTVSSLTKDKLNLAGKNLAYKDSEGNINVTADTYTADTYTAGDVTGENVRVKADGIYVKDGGAIVSRLTKDKLDLAGENLAHKDSEGNINVTADTYTAGDVAGENVRVKADGIYVKNGGTIVSSLKNDGLMLTDQESGKQTLNATDIADIKGIDRDIVEETFGDVTTTTKTTTIEGALKVSDNGFISNANESFTVDANGTLTAAGGRFTVSDVTGAHFYGSDSMFSDYTNINGGRIEINGADGSQTVINGGKVTSTGDFITLDEEGKQKYTLNTIGVDLDTLEGNVGTIGKNVGGISREGYENAAYGEGRTEIEDLLAVNGAEGKVSVMGKDGTVAVITKDGTARFGVETGKNLRWKNGELAINSSGEDAVAKLSEEGLMLTDANGAQTLTAAKIADIKGITRDPVAKTTTIEGVTSFNSKGMTTTTVTTGEIGVGGSGFYANSTGITVGNGRFSVDSGTGNLAISNGTVPVFQVNGENGQVNIGANGGSQTVITGNSITTETLNVEKIVLGDKIVDKETGDVIGGELEIGADGSIKIDNANTDAVEFNATKTALSANYGETSLNMDSNGFNLNNGTGADAASLVLDAKGFAFKGSLNLGAGSDVKYTGGNYGTLAKLDATVKDIYDRTDGIYKDSAGNTVISNEEGTWNDSTQKTEYNGDGSKVVVGDKGTTFENGAGNGTTNIDGSKITSDADGTISGGSGSSTNSIDNPFGTSTSNGEETVYDGENGNTNTINSSGMTVTNGTSTTVIGAEKVDTTTGNFSNKVTVGSEGNQTVITGGDVTVDNSVTVGGSEGTIVGKDGVTVGGDKGTSIKNDSISVGDGGYIGDGDVRSGEGVSLNQTAERVGHLENRVGKLEDRIDKVGAMAAAIANLRTMGYDPAAPTEVAVGIGQYRDETGAALGLFHYPNRDFMLSLSVSTSGDEVMGGIGATWKFGRKSPEKVAEIKKAQAEADARRAEEAKLAKAEEMKQAAKEAKIKAQQERHAKLAAERAAQAEAAK